MPTPHLNTVADITTRAIAVATVGGLAALAGWISYHHMLLLAHRHGIHGIDAHAFPLCVDGLELIGVLVLLADRRARRASGPLPWTVLGVGTAASIAANVAVAPDDPIARAISGWPAIALLAAAKMLAHLFEPAAVATRGHHTQPATAADRKLAAATAPPPTADTPPDKGRRAARSHLQRRIPSDVARRVPTTPDAYARWCAIWDATRHLPVATRDIAHSHGVALRTLQFIRAAGEAGLLTPPPNDPAAAPEANHPAQPAAPDHREPDPAAALAEAAT